MVKAVTYFATTLGAFMLWQTLDKQETMKRAAEIRRLGEELIGQVRCYIHSHTCSTKLQNSSSLPQHFDYKEDDLASEERLWDLYERWMSHHKISRSSTEKQQRFGVFKANFEYVHKVNRMDLTYKLGLNQFADMTNEEFVQNYTGYKETEQNRLEREEIIRRARVKLIQEAKEKETLFNIQNSRHSLLGFF